MTESNFPLVEPVERCPRCGARIRIDGMGTKFCEKCHHEPDYIPTKIRGDHI